MKADMLPLAELWNTVSVVQRKEMILAVSVQAACVVVIFGDGRVGVFSRSLLVPSGQGITPDFTDVKVIDHGHGVQFGPYDVASNWIAEKAL